jgi:hypothetical protein
LTSRDPVTRGLFPFPATHRMSDALSRTGTNAALDFVERTNRHSIQSTTSQLLTRSTPLPPTDPVVHPIPVTPFPATLAKKAPISPFSCHTYKNKKAYCLPHLFKIKVNRSIWQQRLLASGKFALLHRTNPSRPLHSSRRRCKIPSGPPGSGFVIANPEFRMVEHLRSFRCLNTRADHRVSGFKGLRYKPLHERFVLANPDL